MATPNLALPRVLQNVGMRSVPRGGLGNRLLNHFNLQHIAAALGERFFSANFRDSVYLYGIFRPRLNRLREGQFEVFGRSEVESPDFLSLASSVVSTGKRIVFRPNLLLDSFAWTEGLSRQPQRRVRAKLCESHVKGSKTPSLVLHLRGGDFHQWNSRAILPLDYYVRGLELAYETMGRDFRVRITTDDLNHPALEGLQQHIRQLGLPLASRECRAPLACDFRAMVDADILVASPSTLCLSAAIIGGMKTIHSQEWLDSNGNSQEYFWTKLSHRQVSAIDVMATV